MRKSCMTLRARRSRRFHASRGRYLGARLTLLLAEYAKIPSAYKRYQPELRALQQTDQLGLNFCGNTSASDVSRQDRLGELDAACTCGGLRNTRIFQRERATCAGIGLEPVSCGASRQAGGGGGRPCVVPVRIPLVCTVYAIISHKKFTAL